MTTEFHFHVQVLSPSPPDQIRSAYSAAWTQAYRFPKELSRYRVLELLELKKELQQVVSGETQCYEWDTEAEFIQVFAAEGKAYEEDSEELLFSFPTKKLLEFIDFWLEKEKWFWEEKAYLTRIKEIYSKIQSEPEKYSKWDRGMDYEYAEGNLSSAFVIDPSIDGFHWTPEEFVGQIEPPME